MWGRPRNVCGRHSQDVDRGRPSALHIRYYGDILRTLQWDTFRTLYFEVQRTYVEDDRDVPWKYIEAHMGTSIGPILRTSSERNFAEWDSWQLLDFFLKFSIHFVCKMSIGKYIPRNLFDILSMIYFNEEENQHRLHKHFLIS